MAGGSFYQNMREIIRNVGGKVDGEAAALSEAAVSMFGHVVTLLAMKYRRAPLPVSTSLLRRMVQAGFPTDVDELANFARRFLFLRDERMFLAELKCRSASSIAHAGSAGQTKNLSLHPESI